MQAMADLYAKSDMKGDQVEQQTKLSRILDVAQDLKVRQDLLHVIILYSDGLHFVLFNVLSCCFSSFIFILCPQRILADPSLEILVV